MVTDSRKLNPRGQAMWFHKPYDTLLCMSSEILGGLYCQNMPLLLVVPRYGIYIRAVSLDYQHGESHERVSLKSDTNGCSVNI